MRAERYRSKRNQRNNRDASHSRDQSHINSFISKNDRSYISNRKFKDSLLIQSKRTSNSSWTSASSFSDSRQSYPQRTAGNHAHETTFWRVALNQRFYYISGLMLNGALLSFYSVMAFSTHEVCLNAAGLNITKGFDFAFKLGFYATLADFLNAAFFEFYIRHRNLLERDKLGFVTQATVALQTIYAVMEWVFRAIFVLVSLLQGMIRSSTSGHYCIKEIGVLDLEGTWLFWLILVQLGKIAFLSAWHIVLNQKTKSFFANQFEQSTMYDQTTFLEQDDDESRHWGYGRKADQSSYYLAQTRSHRKQPGRQHSYYGGEDCDETSLMEGSHTDEDESYVAESRHRVKFASNAKAPPKASRRRDDKPVERRKKKGRAEVVGREQRDSKAYYDVEDNNSVESGYSDGNQTMQTSSQNKSLESGRTRSNCSSSMLTSTTAMDQTVSSNMTQSIFNRQRQINNKYMMNDVSKALDCTNMYVFHDKSSLMAPANGISFRSKHRRNRH